jgi:hypothetical protein
VAAGALEDDGGRYLRNLFSPVHSLFVPSPSSPTGPYWTGFSCSISIERYVSHAYPEAIGSELEAEFDMLGCDLDSGETGGEVELGGGEAGWTGPLSRFFYVTFLLPFFLSCFSFSVSYFMFLKRIRFFNLFHDFKNFSPF